MTGVSVGEVVVAARALFRDRSTVNRELFSRAVNASGEEALTLWLLQAGDRMAHFAQGCALYRLGRHREAYRHLRHYTEIAPHGSWNWCWYGKAAQALGLRGEARVAYRRATALEAAGPRGHRRRALCADAPGSRGSKPEPRVPLRPSSSSIASEIPLRAAIRRGGALFRTDTRHV